MLSLLTLESKQKNSLSPFRIRIFPFLSTHFELTRLIRSYIPVVASKISDQNGAKIISDKGAHTYIAYIREYPTPGSLIRL